MFPCRFGKAFFLPFARYDILESTYRETEENEVAKGIIHYEVGEQVDLFLLIKSATKGIASNGKPFLTLILQDKSGDIEAKLWDVSPDDEERYVPECIVKVAGDIHNYRVQEVTEQEKNECIHKDRCRQVVQSEETPHFLPARF